MKKWREWLFVVCLIVLAALGGWMRDAESASLADSNIQANEG